MLSTVDMDADWRYTLVVNNTDSELIVDYMGDKYTLVPEGCEIIPWHSDDLDESWIPPVNFSTGDMEVSPVFSNDDLRENKRIVIFGDLVNSPSRRMTPRTNPQDIAPEYWGTLNDNSWLSVVEFMRTMGELEKRVRIWHNQCKHLLKKYREAVDRVERLGLELVDFSERDLELFFLECRNHPTRGRHRHFPLSRNFVLCSALISFMLEGKALLLSCGESSYNQAVFALTSAPPRVPAFSKFALAIRELAWDVEFLYFAIQGKSDSLDSWEWCEERGRVVLSDFPHRLDASDDDTLEADVRRQNADREALRSSLDLKLGKSPSTSSFKFLNPATWRAGARAQGELESIWRKRLQDSPCAPGSFSPLDAFVIDNPETTVVQVQGSRSRGGSFKTVHKCKWLGQTVALSAMSNVSKVSAQSETGFLARAQHRNVVEWMGYAFQEDLRDPNCYRECFLVTEYMDCDLHDLITQRLTADDGTIIRTRPPFETWIAIDIALQIVEAMIHLHKCRVLHRDLKPKNILASQRYSMLNGTLLYTVKLIDFGSSKSGDEGSHFQTRKQGTPIYMAPEVWDSEDSYSWSADVYSFGLTCFEIFTGRLPLEDGMPCTHANIQKVLRGETMFPEWCPERVQSLISKCCAQHPSERPSFEDIRKALWRLKVLYRLPCPYFLSLHSGLSIASGVGWTAALAALGVGPGRLRSNPGFTIWAELM